jgi:hemerythrin superfamily protein
MVKQIIQRTGFFFRTLTRRKLDAFDLLEADHIRIEFLLFQWRMTNDRARREELFSIIKKELLAHTSLEETYFYPACEKITEAKRLILDSKEEHKQIKHLLREISSFSQGNEKVTAKMKVLAEEVQNHVKNEENVLFPRIRTFMKKNQLDRLSRDLRQAKQVRQQKIAA